MPQFTYVALDARGQESTGLVDASSTNDAIGQLRQAGYFPTTVYEKGQGTVADKKTQRAAKTALAELLAEWETFNEADDLLEIPTEEDEY